MLEGHVTIVEGHLPGLLAAPLKKVYCMRGNNVIKCEQVVLLNVLFLYLVNVLHHATTASAVVACPGFGSIPATPKIEREISVHS